VPVSRINEIPIGKLRPHPANVHKHSKKQISQIADSIQKFGFTAPIIAGENGYIFAGHGRWLAARKIGLSRVPVVIVSGLSDAECRAYLLADNKLTENAGWNRKGLAKELQQLGPLLLETGLDIGLTGFETPEIDALIGDLVAPLQGSDDGFVDVPKEEVTRSGDLWILDDHRLACGDAQIDAVLQMVMGGELATMVFADPPSNASIKAVPRRGKSPHREFVEGSTELNLDKFAGFLVGSLSLAAKYSVPGSIHYVRVDWWHLQDLLLAGNTVYGAPLDLVVRVKTTNGRDSLYRTQHELILVFKNGKAPHINNIERGRNRSNVWSYAGIDSLRAGRLDDFRIHPTVPIALVVDAMRDCSRRGDIVLDPFMGSGTTILAAERIGRRGYGLEIDPLYVDATVRRWQSLTKRDALLSSTDQTFSEVAAERLRRVK
jgi:DNA methylase/ParB-like nuclease family protein